MRLLPFVPLLAGLSVTVAENQVPLKDKAAGWFDKAKSYIPSAMPSIPNPIDAGAAAVAERRVEKINQKNWQRKLTPKLEGEEEWLIYVTGGNKSCFGRCGVTDEAWNAAVPLMLAKDALPGAPPLRLGRINCEIDTVLCSAWAASAPSLWHYLLPALPSHGAATTNTAPKTPLHVLDLNTTTTTVSDITSVPSTPVGKARYLEVPEYEGALHPIDGWMAKLGLQIPMGYVIWGMATTPSWAIMIGISFISRNIMSRRAVGRMDQRAQAGAGGAAPAGAAGAAKK